MSERLVHVYFDYRSPFAYMASEVLPSFAERNGLTLRWMPIHLQRLSNFAEGLPYSPKKRAYVFVDAQRQAEYHGATIRIPKPFPVESDLALRVSLLAEKRGPFDALRRALFRAAWAEEQDISSPEVVARCLRESGGDPAWVAAASRPDVDELLTARTRDADEAGIFGVPTMTLDGEPFWGIDSLPVLEWRLTGSASGRG